ncbi:MAG: BlaI/MecI/CopY family transcriptional regulator [Pirellula sp.]|jgi:BlaI family penicillinase repressor
MARPKASELTERELEIMHAFWEAGESTIADVQQRLEADGRDLAYTTVATLVRILVDKNFLRQTSERRPHTFAAVRSYSEVSGRLLNDLMHRVFGGSAEALVMRLMEDKTLTNSERKRLQELINKPENTKGKNRGS